MIHKCFNVYGFRYWLQGGIAVNETILLACRELIDDAKMGCADLVFKDVCLEILSRAKQVLTQRQFKQLVAYAAVRMKERVPIDLQQELAMHR